MYNFYSKKKSVFALIDIKKLNSVFHREGLFENWVAMSNKLHNRTDNHVYRSPKQIRSRWRNFLSPELVM